MILCDAQSQPDGQGKCGPLPNSTLSSNSAQLPISTLRANTRMSRGNVVTLHRHFKP
jgi:hypothetical protein